MRIIKQSDFTAQILLNNIPHLFRKRTRISDRCAFLNTRSKYYGIRSALDQLPCTKDCLFSWTSTAIAESNKLDIPIDSLKYTSAFSDYFKVSCTGVVILIL
ncbi:hypothetical protein JS73_02055 [Synergistes jonesii]|uniref:Uncharacterized protein n=1 Tax=Synergistes jonesii TaxID=2754 RepID=A0A073IV18_9BACT|nr:hypothetical protein EH55_10695 [Synergistes jonesii]OFB64903.1 hypothetical protein JS73_02055 [Synergistes jonesii]OFB66303.1 hypothetical protein JS79_02060 [Synergistes jonesii]OFB69070.1 hypothetical protein JS78_02060 [Synergistes jonesii]OFB76521.1 hypothetical protein JS77_02070 [Synergistes jonesii]